MRKSPVPIKVSLSVFFILALSGIVWFHFNVLNKSTTVRVIFLDASYSTQQVPSQVS